MSDNIKISELVNGGPILTGAEIVPLVQSGTTRRATVDEITASVEGNVDALIHYGLGTSRTSATILTAVSAIGANNKNLVLQAGVWTINANVTIPANVKLIIPYGALLIINTGITLTVNGPFSAGPYQVFSCTGTGVVAGLKSVRTIWFTGTDLSTEVTAKLQKSLDAISTSGGEWFLYPGTHLVTRAVAAGNYNYALRLARSNVTLNGVKGVSTIKADTNADCTVLRTWFASQDGGSNLSNVTIKNIVVDGNWDNQTWAGPLGTGVYDQNGLAIYAVDGFHIENVKVKNCAQDGLPVATSKNGVLLNVEVENTGKGNNSIFTSYNIKVIGGKRTNANGSPDNGVAKALYTLSSDKYSGIAISYASVSGDDSELQNDSQIIGLTSDQTYGRGISVFSNATGVQIINPIVRLHGTTHGISLNADAITDDVQLSVHGGRIYRDGGGTGRLISATNVKTLNVENVYAYNKTLYGSFVFVDCGTVNANNNTVRHGGAATDNTFDIRGNTSFTGIGNVMDGTISFGTSATTYAYLEGNTVAGPIENRATMLTTYKFLNNYGDTNEVATLTWNPGDIADGDATTQEISVTGAAVGDFVVATFPLLVSASFVNGMQISAVVSEAGKVKVTITNHTGSNQNLDEGTLKVRII